MQGSRAAVAIASALAEVAAEPEVDVVVIARGGGSFEDLLPFSDERLVPVTRTLALTLLAGGLSTQHRETSRLGARDRRAGRLGGRP